MLCPTCTTWSNGGTNPEPVPSPPALIEAAEHVRRYWDAVMPTLPTLRTE